MAATAEKLQERLDDLPRGSHRRRVLECAQRFKSTWVELGRALAEVKRDEGWRGWGFASFDVYCAKELFLRKATVEKLLQSYGFLARHEPALAAAGRAEVAAPPFEVIEVLSRAEAVGQLPEEGWGALRDEVLERPPSPAALSRQLEERWGSPPEREAPGPEERLRRLGGAAERLARGCAADGAVPEAVIERARALADDLRELAQGCRARAGESG